MKNRLALLAGRDVQQHAVYVGLPILVALALVVMIHLPSLRPGVGLEDRQSPTPSQVRARVLPPEAKVPQTKPSPRKAETAALPPTQQHDSGTGKKRLETPRGPASATASLTKQPLARPAAPAPAPLPPPVRSREPGGAGVAPAPGSYLPAYNGASQAPSMLPDFPQTQFNQLILTFPSLIGHGTWVNDPHHHASWIPEESLHDSHWRPYADNGFWGYTNRGLTWFSQYPWGQTTFHFGQWFWNGDKHAWAWKPGGHWAPAWVTWRDAGAFVGWAPVPPAAMFTAPSSHARQPFDSGSQIDFHLTPNHFTFVPKTRLVDQHPLQFAVSGATASQTFQASRPVSSFFIAARTRRFAFSHREPLIVVPPAVQTPTSTPIIDLRNPLEPVITHQDNPFGHPQTGFDPHQGTAIQAPDHHPETGASGFNPASVQARAPAQGQARGRPGRFAPFQSAQRMRAAENRLRSGRSRIQAARSMPLARGSGAARFRNRTSIRGYPRTGAAFNRSAAALGMPAARARPVQTRTMSRGRAPVQAIRSFSPIAHGFSPVRSLPSVSR